MANPQKEHGFVPIANEIMDALARIRISGEARQVLDAILRKTYGFNKKEDRIALSQLCLATGLKKPTVCKALAKLLKMKLITQKDNGQGNILSFAKDIDTWEPLPKKVTLPKKIMDVTQKDNASLPKKPHTKDNSTKDNSTKDIALRGNAGEVVSIIDSFKETNPVFSKWYANRTQRGAIERLIASHGLELVQKVIALLPKTNRMPYMPSITTPLQLEEKWAALEAGLSRKKIELTDKQKYKPAEVYQPKD